MPDEIRIPVNAKIPKSLHDSLVAAVEAEKYKDKTACITEALENYSIIRMKRYKIIQAYYLRMKAKYKNSKTYYRRITLKYAKYETYYKVKMAKYRDCRTLYRTLRSPWNSPNCAPGMKRLKSTISH
jgi:hypothetical protein